MDNTELTEEFLLNKVIAPVVLGMFANDEWDSYAMIPSPADDDTWLLRVVAAQEAIEIPLTFADGSESVDDFQRKLVAELSAFIERSTFGKLRTEDWQADEHNRPLPSMRRMLRPEFIGPELCFMRLRRIRSRNLKLDRRRCRSSHRRS